jgi:hypothetical protein
MTQQYPSRYPSSGEPDPHQWQQRPPQGFPASAPAAPRRKRRWPWVVGAVVLLFAFTRGGEDTPSAASTSEPAAAAAVQAPAPPQEYCASSPSPWIGDGTCRPGGEVVTVRAVVDADTLALTDGRTVRLLAVDAPVLDNCAGDESAAFTRSKVDGKTIKLIAEPGTDRDENGNLWRYVAYSESNHSRTGLPVFAHDLGHDLVLEGWAKPSSGGENAEYMSRLTSAADIAAYRPEGMYAPPCGKPKVYGDDDGNGVADSEEDVDVPNGNAPNVNLPDGALTGGYCARKWWC